MSEGEAHITTLRTRLKKHREHIGNLSLRQVERYPDGMEYHLVRIDALRRPVGHPILQSRSLADVEAFLTAQGIT